MQKITTLLLALFLSAQLFSQEFAENPNYYSGNQSYQSNLNKRFYFRIGLSLPSWNYYGFANANDLKNTLDVKSRVGGNLELGSIFMFHGINIGDDFRLGLIVDWLSFKSQILSKEGSDNIYNFFLGSKIGPSFTYAPAKAIAFDAYFKLNPIWAGAVFDKKTNYEAATDIYYGYVQFMYSVGLNVRVSVLILGIEYDFGNLKLKNSEDTYWPNFDDPTSKKTPMHGINFTIGLNF